MAPLSGGKVGDTLPLRKQKLDNSVLPRVSSARAAIGNDDDDFA